MRSFGLKSSRVGIETRVGDLKWIRLAEAVAHD